MLAERPLRIKKNNCLEITEIPYTTTAEAIIDKIVDLVKSGKLKEVSYVRDEERIFQLRNFFLKAVGLIRFAENVSTV